MILFEGMVSSKHLLVETKDGAAEYSGNKDIGNYGKGFEQVVGGKAKDYLDPECSMEWGVLNCDEK